MATHSSVLAWRIPGTRSLVGCRLWGRTESDTTEATQQQILCHIRVSNTFSQSMTYLYSVFIIQKVFNLSRTIYISLL